MKKPFKKKRKWSPTWVELVERTCSEQFRLNFNFEFNSRKPASCFYKVQATAWNNQNQSTSVTKGWSFLSKKHPQMNQWTLVIHQKPPALCLDHLKRPRSGSKWVSHREQFQITNDGVVPIHHPSNRQPSNNTFQGCNLNAKSFERQCNSRYDWYAAHPPTTDPWCRFHC